MFLQEHWLPYNEVNKKLLTDFPSFNFLSTASDMFTPTEDLLLTGGTAWHGTALGWSKDIDRFVKILPIVSERFCGIYYSDEQSNILSYTAYLPTSGQDEEFLEVISQLCTDINQHFVEKCAIFIGLDSNQSKKSTNRRTEAMNAFKELFSLKSTLVSDQPTFHHNNQTSVSQIDDILYFITQTSQIEIGFLDHLCKLENSSNLSSHDVILAECKLPFQPTAKSSKDFSKSYEPFIVSKPKWEVSGIE